MSAGTINREINRLKAQLTEIKNKEISDKISAIDSVCENFCLKYGYYYDKNKRSIILDTMYSFNYSKDILTIDVDCTKKYIYISNYGLDIKYWEHRPKVLGDFGKVICLSMNKKYLENTLMKTLNRIHKWHRSRPLHPKYVECRNTVY